ncbi:ATP-grasp domain-containing protein [Candidatus Saccharibacteria bacterium]|nr:ATP-grasp domain-containing protein [Candidatus Saccharibacteria bacterium]MBI3337947.1 ATP-grasp domain-containing protein [Candidatus Saccharibacteria bacterium]
MIKSKLSPTLETDEYSYFFTMLSDRFIPLNKKWQNSLEKRFKKPFKPIYILPFYHNHYFEEENYIVLNEWLEDIHKKMGRKDIMNLIYPEDINKQFSQSEFIENLTKKLIKKQGKVFVLSFTSVWLDIDNPNVVVLGPEGSVASRYDAKIEHIRTFKKLGMDTIQSTVYKSIEELRKKQTEYPFFISAMYSSGGIESRAIFTSEDLEAYYSKLRPINQAEPLIAARFVDDIVLAPNSNAIVTGLNKTTMVCVSDQILRNNQYMGNIYPSQASKAHQKQIHEMTIKVGDYLSGQGFKGLFGLDFLITKSGHCYPIDLNPRRQGGYYCNVMSSPFDLIDLELAVILNEPLPKFSYSDFQVGYCWAHSKLTPYFPNMKIRDEINEGDPIEPFKKLGATFKAIYYPKGYTLMVGNPGFYLTSGTSYQEVKLRLYEETEKLISKNYELYEG